MYGTGTYGTVFCADTNPDMDLGADPADPVFTKIKFGLFLMCTHQTLGESKQANLFFYCKIVKIV